MVHNDSLIDEAQKKEKCFYPESHQPRRGGEFHGPRINTELKSTIVYFPFPAYIADHIYLIAAHRAINRWCKPEIAVGVQVEYAIFIEVFPSSMQVPCVVRHDANGRRAKLHGQALTTAETSPGR
jgi:hypothetical protein